MDVMGVKLETTHVAGVAILLGVLVLGAFLRSGKSAPKKKQEKKKKDAPVSGSAKPKASPPTSSSKKDKKKQDTKKGKVEEKAVERAEVIIAPKKIKPPSTPQRMEEGWTTVVAPKKKSASAPAKKAQEEANAAIPGMAVAQKSKKGKKKGTIEEAAPIVTQSVNVDYRKGALEAKAKAEAAEAAQTQAIADAMEFSNPSGEIAGCTATVKVPDERVGVVVGPGGKTIMLIKEKTGVDRIDTSGGVCLISGENSTCVAAAKKAIEDIVNKGYTSLMYENFNEGDVKALPSQFHELIGKQGAIVKQLKEQCGVEVTFPKDPNGGKGGKGTGKGGEKKLKIQIGGPTEGVEQAKKAMNDILEFHHSDITHPGFVHKFTHVEPFYFHVIIGKGGGEMKHISSNYKVKVYIPRGDGDLEDIMVVGEERNVDRAIAYIERSVTNYANKPTGRQDGGASDGMAQDYDDDVDDDLQQYIYKRR